SRKPPSSATDSPLMRIASMMPPISRSDTRPSSMAAYSCCASSRDRLRAPFTPRPISLMNGAALKASLEVVGVFMRAGYTESVACCSHVHAMPAQSQAAPPSGGFRLQRLLCNQLLQFRHAGTAIRAALQLLLQHAQRIAAGMRRQRIDDLGFRYVQAIADDAAARLETLRRTGRRHQQQATEFRDRLLRFQILLQPVLG